MARWVAAGALLAVVVAAMVAARPGFLPRLARGAGLRAENVPRWAYHLFLRAEGASLRWAGVFDADEVAPGLWLGSSHAAHDVAGLRARGVVGVVSAVDDDLHAFAGGDGLSGVGRVRVRAKDDGTYRMAQHFDEVAAFVDKHARQEGGGAVLVHCRRGVSRSATLVAAYLMRRDGIGASAAMARVRAARPRAAPIPSFVDELRAYEISLGRT